MFVRLLVRSLVVMVTVLGMSLAFAWVWDRNDAGVQAATLPGSAGAEAPAEHATKAPALQTQAGQQAVRP
jgi:uncharacterized membrane protein